MKKKKLNLNTKNIAKVTAKRQNFSHITAQMVDFFNKQLGAGYSVIKFVEVSEIAAPKVA